MLACLRCHAGLRGAPAGRATQACMHSLAHIHARAHSRPPGGDLGKIQGFENGPGAGTLNLNAQVCLCVLLAFESSMGRACVCAIAYRLNDWLRAAERAEHAHAQLIQLFSVFAAVDGYVRLCMGVRVCVRARSECHACICVARSLSRYLSFSPSPSLSLSLSLYTHSISGAWRLTICVGPCEQT